ncbi:hypothetical protein HETIRDRAFT_168964 [Heterobasidion irregulare TC 32-1]|uniref:Uncharacterized protein n=1 Tax=Heterobasidion irregulare (strain TC 32-1) TaxID=747525 RepID=W4K8C2_HETIT|nr:uncharacterized protein HETIRDRAFT_168964 [Heterobasidion irregulare TC 32-1]ETW82082.1 hypothetical protein HETIRDRAFT_168964 [Heterobasidion irregulare TC 32-1]
MRLVITLPKLISCHSKNTKPRPAQVPRNFHTSINPHMSAALLSFLGVYILPEAERLTMANWAN